MSAPTPTRCQDSWAVFDYEAWMFHEMGELWLKRKARFEGQDLPVRNAIEESALLHARLLCEIILDDKWPDDIKLTDLLSGSDMAATRRDVDALRSHYGDGEPSTPRWTLNKLLAHPTKKRGTSHDYGPMEGRQLLRAPTERRGGRLVGAVMSVSRKRNDWPVPQVT